LLLVAGGTAIWMAANMNRPAIEVKPLLVTNTKDGPPPLLNRRDVPAGWLDSFELTERSGKKFNTDDMAGKVWAASFFFADCPGECHKQNLAIAQLQKEFGPEGVVFVSISVNPERDTVARLREHAPKYTKSEDQWLFLTGDMDYIRRVGAEYFGVPVDKGTHGSRLILVDKWGDIRGYHSTNGAVYPEEYAAIRPALKKLLAETEQPEEFKQTGAKGDTSHETETPVEKTEADADEKSDDETSDESGEEKDNDTGATGLPVPSSE
jgi:cytochrome oxidase Cu insertion factor (SCO1/SenC/PrrC family)